MIWRSFDSQWSSDNTVLNSNILSNVYNSIIIAVEFFVAYWLLAAIFKSFRCNQHFDEYELDSTLYLHYRIRDF